MAISNQDENLAIDALAPLVLYRNLRMVVLATCGNVGPTSQKPLKNEQPEPALAYRQSRSRVGVGQALVAVAAQLDDAAVREAPAGEKALHGPVVAVGVHAKVAPMLERPVEHRAADALALAQHREAVNHVYGSSFGQAPS